MGAGKFKALRLRRRDSSRFKNADRMLPQHVGPFRALPIHALDKLSLQAKLKAIGEIEGATKLKEPA